ncbi:unnamed protein product [Trifolium pratense]|uniref:Uncharacterized protein n=1 Tax=Trifolium pratense TaxID=57577 RepID=A0ACB0LMJ1_TRIPR|nr:unnamed protein product [Trifolium pratense]
MASSILIKVTYLTMICLVLSIPLANATVSCCNIETTLIPCIGYIRNPGPSVHAPCCDAVKAVSDAAQTPIDRQDTCKCLMSLIKSPGIEFQDVASIPDKCGLDPSFVLTPDLDCNTWKFLNIASGWMMKLSFLGYAPFLDELSFEWDKDVEIEVEESVEDEDEDNEEKNDDNDEIDSD